MAMKKIELDFGSSCALNSISVILTEFLEFVFKSIGALSLADMCHASVNRSLFLHRFVTECPPFHNFTPLPIFDCLLVCLVFLNYCMPRCIMIGELWVYY